MAENRRLGCELRGQKLRLPGDPELTGQAQRRLTEAFPVYKNGNLEDGGINRRCRSQRVVLGANQSPFPGRAGAFTITPRKGQPSLRALGQPAPGKEVSFLSKRIITLPKRIVAQQGGRLALKKEV